MADQMTELPVFPERLTRVAKAIWEHYPQALPCWDKLPEYPPEKFSKMDQRRMPSRSEFRQMARAALEAEGIIIDD